MKIFLNIYFESSISYYTFVAHKQLNYVKKRENYPREAR